MSRKGILQRNRVFLFILFLVIKPASIIPENQIVSVDKWTVLITALKDEGLNEEYRYLLSTIPSMLIETAFTLNNRKLSLEEIKAIENQNKMEKIRFLREEISRYKKEFDLLFFQRDSLAKRNELNGKIGELELRLSDFQDEDSQGRMSDTDFFVLHQIKVHEKNNENRPFVITGYRSLEAAAISEKADGIVYGILEESGGWLIVSFYLYISTIQSTLPFYQSAFRMETFSREIEKIRTSLISALIGRSWGSITVQVEPFHAKVSLRNLKKELSGREFNFLDPGNYQLKIEAPGFFSFDDSVTIKNETFQTRSYTLQPYERDSLEIITFPSGSDVYIDSLWIGRTPFYWNNLVYPANISIRKEGYRKNRLFLSEETVSPIIIWLSPDIYDRKSLVMNRRDRFYRSLGAFFLSIPVTMISYSASSDYAVAHNRALGLDSAAGLKFRSTMWYTAYMGGLFLNVSLFINTIHTLTDYISAVEK